MVKNVAGTWCCDSHNVNRVISGLKVTGIRERPKFMEVPGPGLSTEGRRLFSGKKRGRRLFSAKKRGRRVFQRKKGGTGFSFATKKVARTFFKKKRGARRFFDIPEEGGKTFFSSESRGANTFFLGWKVVQEFFFVSQEFRFGFDIGQW